jgi:3-hydroxyacyl-CoA dehydrogenase/enoyl-CoA hydratase/3-hydroxybutyryl-CoA epimerase
VVLLSGKRDSFITGADIKEFVGWTASQAEAASREGQALLERIERARTPVVAAIHGTCVGGGLELALSCRYRIATSAEVTQLGLPEVRLGLVPGLGGTQRLPRAVGLRAALDLILTGKSIDARRALRLGLVHEMVHPAILRRTAVRRALELATGALRVPHARKSAGAMLLDGNPIGRSLVLRRAREETISKTRGNYPAPLAALRAIAAGYDDRARGFATEARLFGEMAATPQARELI